MGVTRRARHANRPRRYPLRKTLNLSGWPALFTTAIDLSSHVRQNYHRECEIAINRQANLEFYASYTYLSMAYHFDRDDVALKNFSTYFLKQSREIRQQAETLLRLQNQRGGRVLLRNVRKPEEDDWGSGLHAMEHAFHLEQRVNKSLLHLHRLATDHEDPQLCDFLESQFLNKQVKTIKELGDHVSNLSKLEAQDLRLVEYLFDKLNLDDSDKEKDPGAVV